MIVRFISHEVRTPLNTIMLGIDELSASSHHDVLSDMKAASEVAVDTLNDLIAQHRDGWDADLLDIAEETALDIIQSTVRNCQRHVQIPLISVFILSDGVVGALGWILCCNRE